MHSSPLLDLVCSQPEVAACVLRWLCHWPSPGPFDRSNDHDGVDNGLCLSVAETARSIFALRVTCTAFAQWEDSLQLAALLTGRQRPGDFSSKGGFAHIYPVIVDAIDASHGPRVPEDFDTIDAAIRGACTPGARRSRAEAISLNAGLYVLTEPVVMHDGLKLVGRCAPGAAVLQFNDCVGITSAAIGAEVCNVTIHSTGTQSSQDSADKKSPARGLRLHSVWVQGGDLLVRDCSITPAGGHGVLIGTCEANADAMHARYEQSMLGQMPRFVRCHVYGGTAAGVCIDSTSAKLIDCTVSGLELAYSTPGTSIHSCTIYGASHNAVMCHDQAHAMLMHCNISGGPECVRVCDSSDVSLLECEIHDGIKAGVSVEGGGTVVRVEGGSVSGSGNTRVAVSGDALVWMDGKLFATSLPEDRPQPRQPGAQASRSHHALERSAEDTHKVAPRDHRMRKGGRRPHVDISMVVVHREQRRVHQGLWSRCTINSYWRLIKLMIVFAALVSSIKWVRRAVNIAAMQKPAVYGSQPRVGWGVVLLGEVQRWCAQKVLRL